MAPNFLALPRVAVELGWDMRHCGRASGASGRLSVLPANTPSSALPTPWSWGHRIPGRHHLSAGALPTSCGVKRPLPGRALHTQGAAFPGQGERGRLGRYISQGWQVPEHLSPMEQTNWLHLSFLSVQTGASFSPCSSVAQKLQVSEGCCVARPRLQSTGGRGTVALFRVTRK